MRNRMISRLFLVLPLLFGMTEISAYAADSQDPGVFCPGQVVHFETDRSYVDPAFAWKSVLTFQWGSHPITVWGEVLKAVDQGKGNFNLTYRDLSRGKVFYLPMNVRQIGKKIFIDSTDHK